MENNKMIYEAPEVTIEKLESEDVVLDSLPYIPWSGEISNTDW